MLQPLTDLLRWLVIAVCVGLPTVAMLMPSPAAVSTKLDRALQQRAHAPRGYSRVILRTAADARLADILRVADGTSVRRLNPHEYVALVRDSALAGIAARPDVLGISLDRQVVGMLDQSLGASVRTAGPELAAPAPILDGSGVGIAMIDSGVSASHPALGGARLVHWADFVNHLPTAYDDYGHGTHVAGILAGTGARAPGARRGIAPGAGLIVLKALDATGSGHVSDVVSAIDFAIDNRTRFNIRVINLSVAAGVYESYLSDPLTLAALRAVNAGIVVVAAAGNAGMTADGSPQYGTITAPGNAPWVLTVGAGDDRGTPDRADDVVAGFSSRGPSAIDGSSKPDLIAPGVAITSTADTASTLFWLQPRARLWGPDRALSEPYLQLSGTSMAAPLVTGVVSLMLQTAPSLTPNAVKGILQFSAEPRPGSDEASQGAGLVNGEGAVALARQFADPTLELSSLAASVLGSQSWSRRIIWGAQRISAPTLDRAAAAWHPRVVWGSETGASGAPLAWGAMCPNPTQGCGGE